MRAASHSPPTRDGQHPAYGLSESLSARSASDSRARASASEQVPTATHANRSRSKPRISSVLEVRARRPHAAARIRMVSSICSLDVHRCCTSSPAIELESDWSMLPTCRTWGSRAAWTPAASRLASRTIPAARTRFDDVGLALAPLRLGDVMRRRPTTLSRRGGNPRAGRPSGAGRTPRADSPRT